MLALGFFDRCGQCVGIVQLPFEAPFEQRNRGIVGKRREFVEKLPVLVFCYLRLNVCLFVTQERFQAFRLPTLVDHAVVGFFQLLELGDRRSGQGVRTRRVQHVLAEQIIERSDVFGGLRLVQEGECFRAADVQNIA